MVAETALPLGLLERLFVAGQRLGPVSHYLRIQDLHPAPIITSTPGNPGQSCHVAWLATRAWQQ